MEEIGRTLHPLIQFAKGRGLLSTQVKSSAYSYADRVHLHICITNDNSKVTLLTYKNLILQGISYLETKYQLLLK